MEARPVRLLPCDQGFAADLPAKAVEALRHNPNVAYVEQDQTVELFGGGRTAPVVGLDEWTSAVRWNASYTWAPPARA